MSLSIADSTALTAPHPSIIFAAMESRYLVDGALERALRNTTVAAVRECLVWARDVLGIPGVSLPRSRALLIAELASVAATIAGDGNW